MDFSSALVVECWSLNVEGFGRASRDIPALQALGILVFVNPGPPAQAVMLRAVGPERAAVKIVIPARPALIATEFETALLFSQDGPLPPQFTPPPRAHSTSFRSLSAI